MGDARMSAPIRVLQVVGGMDRGGIETWLVHVLRHSDRSRLQMDFMVHSPGPFALEPELRELGARILVGSSPRRPLQYAGTFHRLVREQGPYDVVHSHVHFYSGFVLWLARRAAIPVRIAHSHLGYSGEHENGLLRRMYYGLMSRWLAGNTTRGLAASRPAAAALFGSNWEKGGDRELLYYGIDLDPFRASIDPADIRSGLGIPADAFVIGHAGRMVEQKNHRFIIDIFAALAAREPKASLLLLGDGPLRGDIESQVERAGLRDRVHFVGVRSDVPRVMRGAMDLFLLPSLYEGLPLVGMEAQAAGLPFFVSDAVSTELDVVPELIHRLPLTLPAQDWADRILSVASAPPPVSRSDALQRMTGGPFDIEVGIQQLQDLYAQEIRRPAVEVDCHA
jgi:glycosyltransferase involved in cell wall biosynthesis